MLTLTQCILFNNFLMEENILFNKKLMMLAIIFTCLLAVSAVSAAENATEDIIADVASEDIVSVENNNQTIEQTENEEIIGATDDGTFTALKNKIDNAAEGSTITLENDYVYDDGFDTEGIKITKSLTINGNGHSINALSKSKIFSLSNNLRVGASDHYNFILTNIDFLNGYTEGRGSAICSSGDYNSVMDYSWSWNLDVTNCIFKDNYAYEGGAIYAPYLFIKDSKFINNVASYWGGALYVDKATCNNCIFTSNKASDDDGGAIACLDSLDLNNCSFTSNTAKNGGAVYYMGYGDDDNLNINYCTFTSNNASENGGAVCSFGKQTIKNSDFISNQAANNGGAVYFSGKITTTSQITGTTIEIYTNFIENSNFKDNNAGNSGGATYVVQNTMNGKTYGGYAEKCTFENNKAPNENDVYGTTTVDCVFKGNVVIDAADLNKYYGGFEKFLVKVTEDGKALSNVNVKITSNGITSIVATDSNGQASLSLNLPVGTYDVVSTYDGASATSKFTVKSTLTASDVSGTYMNSKVSATFLNVDGNALVSKQVTFKVGDKVYTATTNSKGVATADVDLGVGTYTVTAINPVNNEQKQFKLVIDKASSAIALASSQNNGVTTLTATLTPVAATGNVIFKVNGEDKSAAIKNGKATLTLSDLEPGDYAVTASYNGDKNLKASASNAVTFNVAEVYPILTADPITKTYGTSTKLMVNLADSKGNAIANADVNVDINGQVTPITTDSNGQATMSINNAPGTYSATITYADAQTTAKITVKKATPKLTAKAKSFKKSVKTKKYTITLKNNKNKAISKAKVTLKVNGKTYKATTNAKGQATFKITKLTKKGKFTAVVKYAGSKYYNAKTAKPKITVK